MEQYKRVCAKIDLDAVKENIASIEKRIDAKSQIVAVIKTDGYGHGAIPLAHLYEKDDRIWGYAVATAEEADILRKAGMKKQILILGGVFPYSFPMLIEDQVRMAVFSYDMAKELSDKAVEMNRTAYIHLKLDTGMGRIGFLPSEESLEDIQRIYALPNIVIEGAFTHFAKADESDKTSAQRQYELFCKFTKDIEDTGIVLKLKHCSNSAGITDLPGVQMDMVRAGIILYGLLPSDEINKSTVPLKPVMSIESHVVHIKKIPKDTGISYGHTYISKEERVIATIPVGYGDGYPRSLSNIGYVLIHGQYAKICGRVCMDQMMIDVTDIKDIKVGDKVVLLGKDGEHTITAEELGELSHRFNYELVCDIGKRVPREFIENGKTVATKDYYSDTQIHWLKK